MDGKSRDTTLSVVIISYNEEDNIGAVLGAVCDIADEIVVVDSNSTDRTREIAGEYGARIFVEEWKGYRRQKNSALEKCTSEWILSLDCDEIVSHELKDSIVRALEGGGFDGGIVNRRTVYAGRLLNHCWQPDRKLRLVRRTSSPRWQGGRVHEALHVDGRLKRLKGVLYHYPYRDIQHHFRTTLDYARLAAETHLDSGGRFHLYNLLINPLYKMFQRYVLQGGFMDGLRGLVIAFSAYVYTFAKYIYVWEFERLGNNQDEREHTKQDEQQHSREKSIRVCFFNSNREWGGGEVWHLEAAKRLKDRGYHVVVAADERGILYTKLMESGLPRKALRISNFSFLNPLKIFMLRRFFIKNSTDAVILNLPSDLKVGGIAARLAGVGKIIYRRGIALPVRDSLFNSFLYGRIITRLIVNSEETRRMVVFNNPELVNSEKVKIVYNGIDLSQFDTTLVDPLYSRENQDETILGNAGRLTHQKNQKFLITLASKLRRRGMKFKLLIAGTGGLDNELREYTRSMKLDENVVFLGLVDDMRRFMKSIDIFLLPSLWEGFGYVLIEAMAAGKPVVAFNTSSNPELVDHGVNGFLADVGEMETFREHTELLAGDRGLRERMGRAGLERVKRYFTTERMTEELEEIILG